MIGDIFISRKASSVCRLYICTGAFEELELELEFELELEVDEVLLSMMAVWRLLSSVSYVVDRKVCE